jgi:hypothetical protein
MCHRIGRPPPSVLRPPISTIGLGRTSRFLGQARAQAAGQNNHLHGSAAPRGLLIGPTRSLSQLGQATSSTSTQRGPPEHTLGWPRVDLHVLIWKNAAEARPHLGVPATRALLALWRPVMDVLPRAVLCGADLPTVLTLCGPIRTSVLLNNSSPRMRRGACPVTAWSSLTQRTRTVSKRPSAAMK